MPNSLLIISITIFFLLFFLSLRDGIIKRFIQAIAGFVAYGLGDHGKLTYSIFRLYRPKFLAYDTTEDFMKNYPEFNFCYIEELVDEFKTGDILLFQSDNSTGRSIGIKWANMTPFTHLAMIYKDDNDKLFAFEASGSTKNVTLTPLMDKLLDHHYNVIAYRKLNWDISLSDHQIIREYMDENLGKLHDGFASKMGFLEMVIAALDFENHKFMRTKFENHRNTEGYFCSELVVDLYMKLGIIPDDLGDMYPDANEYTPGDFTYFVDTITENREKKIIRGLKDRYFDDEIFIIKDVDGQLLSKLNQD